MNTLYAWHNKGSGYCEYSPKMPLVRMEEDPWLGRYAGDFMEAGSYWALLDSFCRLFGFVPTIGKLYRISLAEEEIKLP